ncbi:hypothetical protein HK102_013302 [Quaeritorhiza haematococci]|nr:hypothetical protein HK102_013302 [Quaeritorhiza haematococci]
MSHLHLQDTTQPPSDDDATLRLVEFGCLIESFNPKVRSSQQLSNSSLESVEMFEGVRTPDTLAILGSISVLLAGNDVVALAFYISPNVAGGPPQTTLYLTSNYDFKSLNKRAQHLLNLWRRYLKSEKQELASDNIEMWVYNANRDSILRKMRRQKGLVDSKVLARELRTPNAKSLIQGNWDKKKLDIFRTTKDQSIDEYISDIVAEVENLKKTIETHNNISAVEDLEDIGSCAYEILQSAAFEALQNCHSNLARLIKKAARWRDGIHTIRRCLGKKKISNLFKFLEVVVIPSTVFRIHLRPWEEAAAEHGLSTEIIDEIKKNSKWMNEEGTSLRKYPANGAISIPVHAELNLINYNKQNHLQLMKEMKLGRRNRRSRA